MVTQFHKNKARFHKTYAKEEEEKVERVASTWQGEAERKWIEL